MVVGLGPADSHSSPSTHREDQAAGRALSPEPAPSKGPPGYPQPTASLLLCARSGPGHVLYVCLCVPAWVEGCGLPEPLCSHVVTDTKV